MITRSNSAIPVLEVPLWFRVWRKVRLPLFALIGIAFLTTVGWVTNDIVVSRNIDKVISEAKRAEEIGSVEQIRISGQILSNLVDRYPNRSKARAAAAWQSVLEAVLLGPKAEAAKKAVKALELVGGDENCDSAAATAGLLYIAGKNKEALELAGKRLEKDPGRPEPKLVRAWAEAALGRHKEALEGLARAMQASPKYAPLVIASIEIALRSKQRKTAEDLTRKLQSNFSQKYLYGSLAEVALLLPEWGSNELNQEKLAGLEAKISFLKKTAKTSPPKLAAMALYLESRIDLAFGRLKDAAQRLQLVSAQDPDPEILAWSALAERKQKTPRAALDLLDARADAGCPEIFDVRAQCYLDYNRVAAASVEIDKLKKDGSFPERVKDLEWYLSVRKGDLESALSSMPEKIDAEHAGAAIEMYYQLKDEGNKAGIFKLAKSFAEDLKSCADAIQKWHGKSARQALKSLKPKKETPCVGMLAARLLFRRVEPDRLKKAAEAAAGLGYDMQLEIDKAMAAWLADGRDAAVEMLAEILKAEPDDAPVRRLLAGAYLEIGLPKRALEVIGELADPESLELSVRAARKIEGKEVSELIKAAVEKNRQNPHPAVSYLDIRSKFEAGRLKPAYEEAIRIVPGAGRWTSEIAEIGAKALHLSGEQKEADQFLAKTTSQVAPLSGIDESWEVELAHARLCQRMGQKYKRKAEYIMESLAGDGVADPEIYHYLALEKMKDGNEKAASQYFKKALALDPGFEPAYLKLKSIDELDDAAVARMKKVRP